MISIRECTWRNQKKTRPEILEYLSQHLLMNRPRCMTDDQLLERVRNREFYGYIEVDIDVGEPGTPTYDLCEECTPIYRHAHLNVESGGPYMALWAKKNNVSPTRSRMLIGALNAKKMFFISDLLAFYLGLGLKVTKILTIFILVLHLCLLKVTKIFSAVEFVPKQIFRPLADLITQKRREVSSIFNRISPRDNNIQN